MGRSFDDDNVLVEMFGKIFGNLGNVGIYFGFFVS